MFITMFFIKLPDPAEAKKMDEAYMGRLKEHPDYETHKSTIEKFTWNICEETSQELYSLMEGSKYIHLFCFMVCFYKEVIVA